MKAISNRKKNNTSEIFSYTVDSFEDYYLLAWIGLAVGGILNAALIWFVVYVL